MLKRFWQRYKSSIRIGTKSMKKDGKKIARIIPTIPYPMIAEMIA
jgi:hypothetical protein